MKKLLFLASFVFETGKVEYNDNQLVMVTDRDVQRFTEKQKALNPDKGERGPYEHYDAAYDVFRTWFDEVFPESTLKHIMCKRPIQSGLFFPKIETDSSAFINWSTDTQKPEDIGKEEGYSDDVLIDLDGYRKNFRVGWYDHDEDKWMLHDKEAEKDIDRQHMKWTNLPLASRDKK